MSKKFLKEIILKQISGDKGYNVNRSFSAELNRIARQHTDKLGLHYIDITVDDIYDLIAYNYVVAFQRPRVTGQQNKILEAQGADRSTLSTQEKAGLRVEARGQVINRKDNSALRQDARKVSLEIFKSFVTTYNRIAKPKPDYKAIRVGNKIEIFQPKNHFSFVKEAIIELFNDSETVKESSRLSRFLTDGGAKKFSRLTQFHHTNRTVGQVAAKGLAQAIRAGKLDVDAQAQQAALDAVITILRRVEYDYELVDDGKGRKVRVTGKPGPLGKNAPGDQKGDWVTLLPRLETAVYNALLSSGVPEKLAREKSSQPLDEKLAKTLVNDELLEGLLKNPKVKGTKFKTDPKNRRAKDRTGKSKVTPRKKKGSITGTPKKMKPAVMARQPKRSDSSLTRLLGPLNQQLSEVVRKNMKEPALVNRTGRFASSVKATDVIKTPQGYPSIGYTYEKNPYQTFEVGYRQGSIDQDPRRLIDKSIREIAVQFAIGRFYTRRV